MKRVVVTGIGVVSCLGNNQDEVYKSLLNAKSGITFSEEYKEYNLKSHVHGKPKIKLEEHVDRKFIRLDIYRQCKNYIFTKSRFFFFFRFVLELWRKCIFQDSMSNI